MAEELKGILTGGGGGGVPPYRGRPRPQTPAPEEESQAQPARQEDSAQLSASPSAPLVEGVRELLGRIEALQKDLLSASDEEGRRAGRARLAQAEVALSNLLGAGGEPSEDLLGQAVRASPALSPERVLRLLGDGGGP